MLGHNLLGAAGERRLSHSPIFVRNVREGLLCPLIHICKIKTPAGRCVRQQALFNAHGKRAVMAGREACGREPLFFQPEIEGGDFFS